MSYRSSKDRNRSFSNSASAERSPRNRRSFSDSDEEEPRKTDEPKKRRSPIPPAPPSRPDRSRRADSASPYTRRAKNSHRRKRFSRSRSRSTDASSGRSRSRSRTSRRHDRGNRRKRKHIGGRRRASNSPTSRRSYSRSPGSASPSYRKKRRRKSHSKRHRYDSDDDRDRGPMLTYKQFVLTSKDDISGKQCLKLYEQYQREFNLTKSRRFFERHKDEEWFQEKYDPVMCAEQRQRQVGYAIDATKRFHEMHQNGEIPVDVDVLSEVELKQLEDDSENPKDDEMEDGEQNADSEDGDENEKENADNDRHDDDDDQNDGNKSAKDDENKTDDEVEKDDPHVGNGIEKDSNKKFEDCAVFIQSIPLKCARKYLNDLFSKVPGYVKMVLSEPLTKQRNNRYGWVTYEEQDQCRQAMKLNGTKVAYDDEGGHFFLHVLPKRRSNRKVRFAPAFSLAPQRISSDLERALKLTKQLDKDKGIEDVFDEDFFSSFPQKLQRLNLLLYYLRFVHYFCYYCVKDCLHEEGMLSKCGKTHSRCPRPKGVNKDVSDWGSALDEKVDSQIENPRTNDVLKWKENTILKFQETNTRFIAKGRHRCRLCTKLFSGSKFVHKHIQNKHSTQIDENTAEMKEYDFFKNYTNDPDKLTLESFEAAAATPGAGGAGSPAGAAAAAAPAQNGPYGGATSRYGRPPPGGPSIVIPASGGAPYYSNSVPGRPPPMPPAYVPLPYGQMPQQGGFRGGGYRSNSFGNRQVHVYHDLDKPPGDAEEEIDYGLGDPKPNFHL